MRPTYTSDRRSSSSARKLRRKNAESEPRTEKRGAPDDGHAETPRPDFLLAISPSEYVRHNTEIATDISAIPFSAPLPSFFRRASSEKHDFPKPSSVIFQKSTDKQNGAGGLPAPFFNYGIVNFVWADTAPCYRPGKPYSESLFHRSDRKSSASSYYRSE